VASEWRSRRSVALAGNRGLCIDGVHARFHVKPVERIVFRQLGIRLPTRRENWTRTAPGSADHSCQPTSQRRTRRVLLAFIIVQHRRPRTRSTTTRTLRYPRSVSRRGWAGRPLPPVALRYPSSKPRAPRREAVRGACRGRGSDRPPSGALRRSSCLRTSRAAADRIAQRRTTRPEAAGRRPYGDLPRPAASGSTDKPTTRVDLLIHVPLMDDVHVRPGHKRPLASQRMRLPLHLAKARIRLLWAIDNSLPMTNARLSFT
jgi:hypothetical protein